MCGFFDVQSLANIYIEGIEIEDERASKDDTEAEQSWIFYIFCKRKKRNPT